MLAFMSTRPTAVPTIAYAQKDSPAAESSKPTIADAQKLVQTISSSPAKLKVYCDMGKLQEQMEQANQEKITRRSKLSG